MAWRDMTWPAQRVKKSWILVNSRRSLCTSSLPYDMFCFFNLVDKVNGYRTKKQKLTLRATFARAYLVEGPIHLINSVDKKKLWFVFTPHQHSTTGGFFLSPLIARHILICHYFFFLVFFDLQVTYGRSFSNLAAGSCCQTKSIWCQFSSVITSLNYTCNVYKAGMF